MTQVIDLLNGLLDVAPTAAPAQSGAPTAAPAQSGVVAEFEGSMAFGFALYKMEAITDLVDDISGVRRYISICNAAGLHPIGCGTRSFHCNARRYDDAECVEMPEDWGCNMMTKLSTTTGWTGENILAYQDEDRGLLYAVVPQLNLHHPQPDNTYSPICGKSV